MKNKRQFILGFLFAAVLFGSVTAFAESSAKIDVFFGRIKLVVDNKPVDKETLLYDGTTYVPLRAAAEALGKEVAYDDSVKTAYIDEPGTGRKFVAAATNAPTPTPVTGQTTSQKNAVKSAKEYLQVSSFSREGLIAQLEYEKFSNADAVYGADNCGANWNEQAAKSARQYLDTTSFSRDGLIDQLIYEKFTREQAEYGATAVGL